MRERWQIKDFTDPQKSVMIGQDFLNKNKTQLDDLVRWAEDLKDEGGFIVGLSTAPRRELYDAFMFLYDKLSVILPEMDLRLNKEIEDFEKAYEKPSALYIFLIKHGVVESWYENANNLLKFV